MALFSVSLVSCAGKQVEKKTEKEGQAKDTTKELTVELGGSIDQLVRNGKLQYNTQDGTKYSLINKTLNGIAFEEAGVNAFCEDCDTIKSIHYASGVLMRDMNEIYTNIYLYLKSKYGVSSKEKKSISIDGTVQYTKAVWELNNKVVLLSSSYPRCEEKGFVIVAFISPSATKYFDMYLKD